MDSITSKSSVLTQLNAQCAGAMFVAHGIDDRAWRKFMNGGMSDFMKKYAAGAVSDKRPVQVIGQQVREAPLLKTLPEAQRTQGIL